MLWHMSLHPRMESLSQRLKISSLLMIGFLMISINIIKNPIIKRDEIFNLWLRDSILGCSDICQSMRHQHPSMLVLHSLEQLEDTVLDTGVEDSLIRSCVAFPSTHLLEHKL